MRRAAKKDENHNGIAAHLRALGWSVLDLSRVGNGIPDLVVGKPGFAALIEIKRDGNQKLRESQEKVRRAWEGPYIVATSEEEAEVQLAVAYLNRLDSTPS